MTRYYTSIYDENDEIECVKPYYYQVITSADGRMEIYNFVLKKYDGRTLETDYKESSKIRKRFTGSFKSSKFSGGALTLTINGGGTVIFDGVAKGDKFNINGKTYTISGSKLK